MNHVLLVNGFPRLSCPLMSHFVGSNRNWTDLIEFAVLICFVGFRLFIYFPYFLFSSLFFFCCGLVSRNVASAPVMESPPENRTVRDGRDETFSCKAGGAPTPNITWIFNG